MATVKLDGAGMAKLKTLDEAMLLLQRIHGLVEMYAMAIKRGQPAGPLVQNLRRTFPTLSENLKGQFGLIADQVMAVNLATSRGASESVRVRTLREGVAQIKQSLEIAVTQVKDRHAVKEESRSEDQSEDAGSNTT
jgi:hypothetical protein